MQPNQYPPQYGQPQAPAYGMPAYPYPGQVSGPASPGMPGMPPMSNGGLPQMPGFSDPRTGGAGTSPSIAELAGRAIIAVPTAVDPNAKGYADKKDEIWPSVTFDAYVLDGGPLTYGAAPKANPPRPAMLRVDTVPAKFTGIVSSHGNIYRALASEVGKGVVLGRIVQGIGTKGTPPWNLAPLEPGDPARVIADGVRAAVNAGTFVSPTPIELTPAAVMPQPPAGYGQPAYAQPYSGPPAGYGQPPYAQAPQAQPAPQPPVQPQGAQAPPGFPPGLWAQMTPADQAAYLAANGQHAPQAPPMPAGY